jgi:enterochelin esterase family protein
MCSPGTEIVFQGKLYPDHCLNSASPDLRWRAMGARRDRGARLGTITHSVNGQKVLEYELPQYGGGAVNPYNTTTKPDGELIDGGYISLQSESHPIDFRKVELLNLAGCMDKSATNYKSYYLKSVPGDCKFADGRQARHAPSRRVPVNGRLLCRRKACRRDVSKARSSFTARPSRVPCGVTGIWVPAQYNPKKPANVLVFQDGQRATNPEGSLRRAAGHGESHRQGTDAGDHRHLHHAGQSRRYLPRRSRHEESDHPPRGIRRARRRVRALPQSTRCFPRSARKYNLTDDPEKRAIGGTSSGAICAFTVAVASAGHVPAVISIIGSYTSIGYSPAAEGRPMIPGGDLYPTLIRKNPIKPIRIFLQDGAQDLSNEHGNWFLANQQMLSAFEFATPRPTRTARSARATRCRHNWGDGAHSDQHGGALLPEILKWIWLND